MKTSPTRKGNLLTAITVALASAAFVSLAPLHAAKPANPGKGKGGGGSSSSCTYSGRAIALKVDGVQTPVPGQILVGDTGPLPSAGGHLQVSQSNYSYAGGALTIDHLSAITSGSGGQTHSSTTLTGFHVEFVERDSGEEHRAIITADFIYGDATATVEPNGQITLSSNVIIQNLTVNGQPILVTGAPNQRVDLPPEVGGYLIINEVVRSSGRNTGEISVTPIHFFVCHCIEGHIGQVRAGITCDDNPPPPEEDCGKVTGGGWIVGTPSGAKGTFGMSGGIRRGEPWGHLTFNDHGANLKVHSTAPTSFAFDPTDPNGRIITYNVTINGTPGTARLRVVDNGEPGRNDIFDLTLSTGYRAAGDLGGPRPGGGNIQNHKCPPGWRR